jgi:hypothetical protein
MRHLKLFPSLLSLLPLAFAGPPVAVLEFEARHHPIQICDFVSSVATWQGAAFVTWIDADARLLVARIDAQGQVSSNVLKPKCSNVKDLWHLAPSVGIDRDGYVHVAGDLHYNPWQYWVSERPGDVSAFTFRGNLPETDYTDKVQSNAPPGHQRRGRSLSL